MKIAVFSDVFMDVPGGIPSSILAQKEGLEALGHEVTVFAPGLSKKSLKTAKLRDSVELVPSHKLLKLNGAPVSKRPGVVIKAIIKKYPKFDFDVVHVHYEASCSIAGAKLARQFSKPLIQTMHGREDMAVAINIPLGLRTIVASLLSFLHSRYIPHSFKIAKDRNLAPTCARAKMWELMVNHANFADKVITPSAHFARKLEGFGVKRQITVVSNGVADQMVKEVEQRVARTNGTLLRKVEDGDVLRLFWNSRLSNEKRIIPFLEALKLMKEPFYCTFCGDGNALNKARKFSQKNGLDKKTAFLGRVTHEEVLDKMVRQHLSVTVSYGFDTQGLTLLEAEATGMPVFFCDPDMKEVVPTGGAVVADGPEPLQMARALDGLARDPERIEQMSRVMLAHRGEILQSTLIKKLLAVYQK